MWGSGKRLGDDVRRWRGEGWVTAEGETRILAELAQRGSGVSLASALGILASVLLGFAVMSFVAAHWEDMSRIFRLLLLFGLILAGYGAAGFFETRGKQLFADAAILFSVAAFGASIMLIAQMFHIDGNPPVVTSVNTVANSFYLTAGVHIFNMRMNNNGGNGGLVVQYQGPDTGNVLTTTGIPASVLS